MPTYNVHCSYHETQSWEEVYGIEAESEEEAIEIAEKQFYDEKEAGRLISWFEDGGKVFAEEEQLTKGNLSYVSQMKILEFPLL